MNKKDFFNNVNAKACNVVSNSPISRYRYIYNILRQVQGIRKQGHTVTVKMENNAINLSNGQFFWLPVKPKQNQAIENRSSFITVGTMRVEKKDISITGKNTFKTKNFKYTLV